MAKKGRPRKRARNNEGRFIGDNPLTIENEAWEKPENKLWDIVLKLKGTAKKQSFFSWLTGSR
jgi:hypothetical protein